MNDAQRRIPFRWWHEVVLACCCWSCCWSAGSLIPNFLSWKNAALSVATLVGVRDPGAGHDADHYHGWHRSVGRLGDGSMRGRIWHQL